MLDEHCQAQSEGSVSAPGATPAHWRRRSRASTSRSTSSLEKICSGPVVPNGYLSKLAPRGTRPGPRPPPFLFVGHQRRALLVMATGSGETRTVVALVDLLRFSQFP